MDETKERNPRSRKRIAKGMKKHVENMSMEAMKATFLKRKECIQTAQDVVTKLIEPNVDEKWMLQNLQFINQSHYDDVVEERFLLLICGYPLCDNVLESVPKQTYKISTKTNKVYNIMDRKKYCSNLCYKASKNIKEQMYTSPLWLREFEEEVHFKLYREGNPGDSAGVEVDIRLTEEIAVDGNKETKNEIISLPSISQEETEEKKPSEVKIEEKPLVGVKIEEKPLVGVKIEEKPLVEVKIEEKPLVEVKIEEKPPSEVKPKSKIKKKVHFKEETLTHLLPHNVEGSRMKYQPVDIRGCELSENDEVNYEEESKLDSNVSTVKKPKQVCIFNEEEEEEISEVKKPVEVNPQRESTEDVIVKEKKTDSKCRSSKYRDKEISLREIVMRIEQKVKSWITVDTLCFLLGEECVHRMFTDVGTAPPKLSVSEKDEGVNRDRYDKLCQSLALAEMRAEGGKTRTMKPVPNFEELKSEAQDLRIKVQDFYRGDRVQFKEEPKEESWDPVMPLMDHHSVRATRRKILLDKLCKNLPDAQGLLGLAGVDLGPQVKGLVATLNLSPTNILFRTSELPIVSIMVIKLLSLKNEHLRERCKWKSFTNSLEALLGTFELDLGYLDRLISYLTEIGPFLPKAEKA